MQTQGAGKARGSILYVILFVFGILFLGSQAYTTPAFDFRAFYCAGWVSLQHHDPYRTEPLHLCERTRTDNRLSVFSRSVVIPAPIPGYDVALFEALSSLPFGIAKIVWIVVISVALFVGVAALCRLTQLSLVAGFALWVALMLPSAGLGECIPLALAGVFAATLAARMQNWNWTAVGALFALVEPHIGAPVCLALALWSKPSRPVLLAGLALLAALSAIALPVAQIKEYFLTVLPLHALSEIGSDGQLSLSVVLHHLGIPDKWAILGGVTSYALLILVALFCCQRLRRRFNDDAFLIAVPAALAIVGGTFIHVTDMPAAVPLVFLFMAHLPRYRDIFIAALILLIMPWWQLVLNYVSSASSLIVIVAAVLCIAWELRKRILYALGMSAFTGGFLIGIATWYNSAVNVFVRNPLPAYSGIDNRYPESSWAALTAQYISTGLPVSFVMRAPTWLALVMLTCTVVMLACGIKWPVQAAVRRAVPSLVEISNEVY